MAKIKETLQELRSKTADELFALSNSIRNELHEKKITRHFSDETEVRKLRELKGKLNRTLTVMREKQEN